MKIRILSCLLCFLSIIAHCQEYFVSSNANSLIDTYRDLLTITNADTTCHYDDGKGNIIKRRCNFSAMPAKGYRSDLKAKGFVTFTSQMHTFCSPSIDPNVIHQFRSSWSDSYIPIWNQYTQCYPSPISFPYITPNTGLNLNVILIPVAVARRNVPKIKDIKVVELLSTSAIKPIDIKVINDIWVEKKGGFISKYLSAEYENIHSSRGLVCEVLLKNGHRMQCYIFNDYDNAPYLVWKTKK